MVRAVCHRRGSPPVGTEGEPDAEERGACVAQRRPQARDVASPLTPEMTRLYLASAVFSSFSVHLACSSLALVVLSPKARAVSATTEPGLLTGKWAAQSRVPAAGHGPPTTSAAVPPQSMHTPHTESAPRTVPELYKNGAQELLLMVDLRTLGGKGSTEAWCAGSGGSAGRGREHVEGGRYSPGRKCFSAAPGSRHCGGLPGKS